MPGPLLTGGVRERLSTVCAILTGGPTASCAAVWATGAALINSV